MLLVPGTILQLIIAFVFSLLCMLLTAVASPFVSDVDDTIGKAFGFALSSIFFFAVVIKVHVLTEAVDDYLPQQLRKSFDLDSVVIATLMTITIAIALVVTIFVALQQVAVEAHQHRPRAEGAALVHPAALRRRRDRCTPGTPNIHD